MGRGTSKAGGGNAGGQGKPNDATEWYVSGEGMWINQYLRGRGEFGELSDTEKQMLKDLDTATNGKITDDTLYRSVDAEAIFGRMSDSDYQDLSQMLMYGEKSFGKGSTSSDVAENWGDFTGSEKPVVMKITTSKNTRGVNLSGYDKNVSKSEAQHERLLARNQSYNVKKIYAKDGTIYVDVKMR